MGLFSRLFGKKDAPADSGSQKALVPRVVFVLRRGMNVPSAEYVAQVIAAGFPGGLPESVKRVGLSQPSWYKTEEVADAIASGVIETFARQMELLDPSHVRRPIDGPDGCACLIVELYDLA